MAHFRVGEKNHHHHHHCYRSSSWKREREGRLRDIKMKSKEICFLAGGVRRWWISRCSGGPRFRSCRKSFISVVRVVFHDKLNPPGRGRGWKNYVRDLFWDSDSSSERQEYSRRYYRRRDVGSTSKRCVRNRVPSSPVLPRLSSCYRDTFFDSTISPVI